MNRQISRIVSAGLAGLAFTLAGCASQQSASSFWKEHYVYVSAASGNNDIYLSDLQGKGVKQLTSDPTDDAHPACRSPGTLSLHHAAPAPGRFTA